MGGNRARAGTLIPRDRIGATHWGGGSLWESLKWSIVCAAVFPYHMTSYDLREEGPARALHLGRAGRVMEWDMMQEEEEDVGSRRKQNVLNSYTGVCVGVGSFKRR